jgi:hypothetical protein
VHFVGKAVASILQHPEKTANKYLSVASFNVSVNEIIAAIEGLTGEKYAVAKVASADLQKLGEDKLAKGDYSAFLELVTVWNYKDGAGKGLTAETSANELLGLKEEDFKATVKAWLGKQGRL